MKEMAKIFVKYCNDKIIIDELISILINIAYFLPVETNMDLLS